MVNLKGTYAISNFLYTQEEVDNLPGENVMNYYKNNVLDPEKQMLEIVETRPMLMNYKMVPSIAHDNLIRCSECNIKYDMHLLTRSGFGVYLCKFCLNRAA